MLVAIIITYIIGDLVREDVKLVKDESSVFLETALNMEINVTQVQQYLTDISATRGLNGLDDGFEQAEKCSKLFLSSERAARGGAAVCPSR